LEVKKWGLIVYENLAAKVSLPRFFSYLPSYCGCGTVFGAYGGKLSASRNQKFQAAVHFSGKCCQLNRSMQHHLIS
jgi:hypothetical protein